VSAPPVSPAVSVIVLTYNGRQWLRGCLDGLAGQRGAPPFETIVVDNASSDGSAAYVRERHPEVRVHESPANLGFAEGNNEGARIARGRLLVFLNNDTVPEPDWLARLEAGLSARPDVALATSRIVSMDAPVVIDSAGDGYLRAGGAFKHGHGAAPDAFAESREVFGACGAAFMIRREVFDELGGFDRAFFMVYEDVDLSYRARLLGYRCWFAADAVVRHKVSGTLGRMSPAAVFYGQRNLEWTWLKNTPSPLLLRSAGPHIVYSIAGIAYYARRGALGAAIKGKLSALAGLGRVLAARSHVQRTRRRPWEEMAALMEPRWLALKRREKQAMEGPA
jgi:GT2 family glycosyltransferase